MKRSPSSYLAVLGVGLVAVAAVVTSSHPLYAVVVLSWLDLTTSLVRRTCQTLFAAPRETVSPTGAAPAPEGGNSTLSPYEQGFFRFFSAKVGSVTVADRLPPVSLHNVRPFVNVVFLSLFFFIPVAAVGVSSKVVSSPVFDEFWSRPTPLILAAGTLASAAKHGLLVRNHARSEWPTAGAVAPRWRFGLWMLYWVPLWFLTALHATGPEVGDLLTLVAGLVVVGRTVRDIRSFGDAAGATESTRSSANTTDSASSTVSSLPSGEPCSTIRPNRRAVRLAGAVDSLLPFGNAASSFRRVEGQYAIAVVLLVGVPLVGHEVWGITSLPLLGAATVATLGAYIGVVALIGVVHFELAFGALEYRLSDDELVAYDRRLDAVQWCVPLDAIRDATAERALFDSPPATDAAMVALDRTDDAAETEPYRFYCHSLAFVDEPERVAERLTSIRSGPEEGQNASDAHAQRPVST
ncbi:hypothetical protein E6P09_08730 [Haloferax mediterranei ATCC 33500]|uniref:Uncharacterized protein n=1 Tax=Haloferax mediterranei (strain ATCC 33500 / DSM 1411 / JCM 8866 / NBRC 14739 / NCIMB 2177 / R-4) TaxID=523841 RepID=I3R3P8_HALMT|nr:hypothetical protein [Haloferax mediterranei]AFK18858.1 hypothetical protein HFX_1142 [Haloferax mediterranei ATCC 33500]AHZ21778.1 hypothetical protein BM92_03500 [Haloferax mediterranei ATCC 33500]EMA03284.1 hypothetical protein C439_04780 [Haloferax mediterranei ATCC 33500]MDX5988951.1 hypothetical protein [Haloferax mediterranei ATCC 33500]QCQ75345.1 hypothetical protein E6P09_08730 [Haloferax mediterranei ATCC 33500]